MLVTPQQCTAVVAAVVRVFNEQGDRTDRKKARLKYVLDRMGHDGFLREVEAILPAPLLRLPLDRCEPRPEPSRDAHIGVHPQLQEGLVYIGVVLPVGRLTTDQMRGLSAISEGLGGGGIRLTVWQNLIIPDVPEDRVEDAKRAIEGLGLDWEASSVRRGLVACTGNRGCRFAASDTKSHAMAIADHLDARLGLDVPLNLHVTGCHNSCAQHYIGDIGLLGAKVAEGDDEMVEGYHLFVGGGYGRDSEIGRELLRDVKAEDAPEVVERLLLGYLRRREGPDESFRAFVARHPIESLRSLLDPQVAHQD